MRIHGKSWHVLAFSMASLLMACTEIGPLSDIPRPYQPSGKDRFNVGQMAMANHIVVGPVEGLSAATNDALRRQLADALLEREVLATVQAPAQRTSLLTGQFFDRPTHSIEWSLQGPYGSNRTRMILPVSPDLLLDRPSEDALLAHAIDLSAVSAAEGIFQALTGEDRSAPTEPEPPTPLAAPATAATQDNPPAQQANYPKLLLLSVLGAPGTGNRELGEGIERALRELGVPLTQKPGEESFQLQCIATRIAQNATSEIISLTWELKSQQGKIVASLDQSNSVAKGSLDGAWGETADLITISAAIELAGFLAQVGSSAP